MPARAGLRDLPLYTLRNISPTPETFSHPNAPYSIIPGNVSPTPETTSSPNMPYPTTSAVMLAKAAPQDQFL